jgi:hypothetical protein
MSESSSRWPELVGCRVAVFPPGAVSGATLGYYGTVVGRWDRWTYLVSIPALDRVIRVESRDMLVLQSSDEGARLVMSDATSAWQPGEWQFEIAADPDPWCIAERRWEIEFESPPEADNPVLRGKYRVGSVEKGRFEFMKVNQLVPSYLFRMPASALGSSRGKLKCKVPADQVLDKAYVMKTLATVLAMSVPSEDEAAAD